MTHISIYRLNLFMKLGFRVSKSSSTSSSGILSWWDPISRILLLWWCEWLWGVSLVIWLAIIIEVVEHKIHIRINLFCEMINNFLLSVHTNFEAIIFTILYQHLIPIVSLLWIVAVYVIAKRTRFWKLLTAHWLLSLFHLSKLVFFLRSLSYSHLIDWILLINISHCWS